MQTPSVQYLTGVAGTNTITAVSAPTFLSYTTGLIFRFIAANTNTGATTININSVGAIACRQKTAGGLAAFAGHELIGGQEYEGFYDGTFFQIDSTPTSLTVNSSVIPVNGVYLSGTNKVGISSNSALCYQITYETGTGTPVNFINTGGVGTGFPPYIETIGSDTNISFLYSTQGTGTHFFNTNGPHQSFGDVTQFAIKHTASSTNYVTVTGSAGGAPSIGTSGGDLALNSNSGNVTAPTPSNGDNSTKIATTAFVASNGGVFTKSFQSTALTMTAASGASIAHGLGGRPKFIYAYIRCLTAELNYAIGDEVPFPIEVNNFGVNAWSDGTSNIRYWIATSFRLPNATTGGDNAITYANWQLFIRAYA